MADGLALALRGVADLSALCCMVSVGQKLHGALIAVPCQLESRDHPLEMSAVVYKIADRLGTEGIYKTSLGKANRSSIRTARRIGLESSLEIFHEICDTSGLPSMTDFRVTDHCGAAARPAKAVDVPQIPAFLCRQTDLLVAAAQTGKPINVKKCQLLAHGDMKNVVNKLMQAFCRSVLVFKRCSSFGNSTLVFDMRALLEVAATGADDVRRNAIRPATQRAGHNVARPTAGRAGAGLHRGRRHPGRAHLEGTEPAAASLTAAAWSRSISLENLCPKSLRSTNSRRTWSRHHGFFQSRKTARDG
jgi:2-dehydro-3-deoxyphosphooctonate aldolase (KDO 8-P synthase)